MGAHRQAYREVVLLGILVLALSACSAGGAEAPLNDVDAPEDTVAPTDEVLVLTFRTPADCTDILPASALQDLASEGIELVRGPGSPSSESVYVEGQTPEELLGGLSCFFSAPDEDAGGAQILLSIAGVSSDSRPGVINGLVGQGLNTVQTNDGALTYWKWGDEVGAAEHNALYDDSWYSAIVQPGGRAAYDQGLALVSSMRSHTTE